MTPATLKKFLSPELVNRIEGKAYEVAGFDGEWLAEDFGFDILRELEPLLDQWAKQLREDAVELAAEERERIRFERDHCALYQAGLL